jgi:hypothetical protein
MTLAELERAEKTMQQQWYDLVMAEQQGSSLEVLEQMYDTYILLAEEYNRCSKAFRQENQPVSRAPSAAAKKNSRNNPSLADDEDHIRLAS